MFSDERRLQRVVHHRSTAPPPPAVAPARRRSRVEYDQDGRRVKCTTPETSVEPAAPRRAMGGKGLALTARTPTSVTADSLLRHLDDASLSGARELSEVDGLIDRMENFLDASTDLDEALLISQMPEAARLKLQDEAANRLVAMVINDDARLRRRPDLFAPADARLAASLSNDSTAHLEGLVNAEIAALRREALNAAVSAAAQPDGTSAPTIVAPAHAALAPPSATPPGLSRHRGGFRPQPQPQPQPQRLASTASRSGDGDGQGAAWVRASLRRFFALFVQHDVCGDTPSAVTEDVDAQLYCIQADRVTPVTWTHVRNSVESLGHKVATSRDWGWQVRAAHVALLRAGEGLCSLLQCSIELPLTHSPFYYTPPHQPASLESGALWNNVLHRNRQHALAPSLGRGGSLSGARAAAYAAVSIGAFSFRFFHRTY